MITILAGMPSLRGRYLLVGEKHDGDDVRQHLADNGWEVERLQMYPGKPTIFKATVK